ncbi:MAG: folate-binding protein YgfZ [Aquiluna sp.]
MTDHYGNPLLEQRKLLSQDAYVERTDQSVFEVNGPDAKSWLHSLLSQNIMNLKEGESAEALLLTPQGRIEQQLKIIATEAGVSIITAADRLEVLIAWLRKMVFRSKVEITERADLRVIGGFFIREGLCWIDKFENEPVGSVRYAAERAEFPYREYLLKEAPTDLMPAGLLAYEALRISVGRPEIKDVDDRSLPHEFDWLSSAVHLSKGCYRGQEAVAKVHNLGHPPRRLIILNLEQGDVLASKDDKVFYQEKEVGKVVAGALHYETGSLALALVNRNTPYLDLFIESGSFRVSAMQEVLVPHDAGKAADLPRPAAFKLTGRK